MTELDPRQDRIAELLLERMERALTFAEAAELHALLKDHRVWRDEDLELAAAAAAIVLSPPAEANVSAGLAARLEAEADRVFVARNPAKERAATVPLRPGPAPARTRRGYLWAAALAVAAALAIAGWWPRLSAVFTTPTEGRTIAWAPGGDPDGAKGSGHIVWSDDRQEGFMTFKGLPANDPTKSQYQLWIFDAARDERFPVDGGVFDIAASDREIKVPIRAKLPVERATLFAVTVERPGGVVVSTRERLVLLAKVN